MKRILILGSGYVSSCLIHFITEVEKAVVLITVGSNNSKELDALSARFRRDLETVLIHVEKDEPTPALLALVARADLVVSLLPNDQHLSVAKACIKEKVNLLHASYNTPPLLSLDEEARKAGILILGEMGLDPGLDHCLAMKCIHEIQEGRGRLVSFSSYCGGLPAPDYKMDNPLHYKFSWSPKTALGNLRNGARFLRNKSIVEVPEGGGILELGRKAGFLKEFGLESVPNRDSLLYLEKYGIPFVKSIFRGTLRYQGFSQGAKVLLKFGYLDEEPLHILDPEGDSKPISWKELSVILLKKRGVEVKNGHEFRSCLSSEEFSILQKLGLVSEALVDKLGTPLDTISKHLERVLKYDKGERDVVILHLELEAKYPLLHSRGESICKTREFREVDFILYGDPVDGNANGGESGKGYSAMAKSVAYTLGITSKMMLNGQIKLKGVQIPVHEEIYAPVLEELTNHGMFAIERISEK